MAVAYAKKIRIQVPVGDETVVMICRKPTAEEQSRFLDDRFQAKGKKVKSHLYEARIRFIDRVLIDVENAQFETASGSLAPLNAQSALSDEDKASASAVLGMKVDGWQDLVPASWKSSAAMHFEDPAPEGGEDQGN